MEEKKFCCPVGAAINEIGGKWKHPILWALNKKKLRFNEIDKILPDVSQRILTKQLHELEQDNLINRKVYAEVPPKVEYTLTTKGKSVIPILDMLCEWGKEYCGNKTCLNELKK